MKIPDFLTHLRHDKRGFPVPWINLWGLEDPERMSIEHDPMVGGPAMVLHDQCQQIPDFTRMNMQRQRAAMVAGLCQVCARGVPWSRRFLVVSDISAERVVVDGRGVTVLSEPWLDERCARFALDHCPALIRRHRRDALSLVAVTSPRTVRLVVSRGWVEGPLEAESKRVQPAMWVKLWLMDLDVQLVAAVPTPRLAGARPP